MSSAATIYLGLDVHKDSVTIAVLPSGAVAPTRVDKLPNDLTKLRRFCERQASRGTVRTCYEASGAGYVIQRGKRLVLRGGRHAPSDGQVRQERGQLGLTQRSRMSPAVKPHIPAHPLRVGHHRVRACTTQREPFGRDVQQARRRYGPTLHPPPRHAVIVPLPRVRKTCGHAA